MVLPARAGGDWCIPLRPERPEIQVEGTSLQQGHAGRSHDPDRFSIGEMPSCGASPRPSAYSAPRHCSGKYASGVRTVTLTAASPILAAPRLEIWMLPQ